MLDFDIQKNNYHGAKVKFCNDFSLCVKVYLRELSLKKIIKNVKLCWGFNVKVEFSHALIFKSYSRKMSFVCNQTFKHISSKSKPFWLKCFAMRLIAILWKYDLWSIHTIFKIFHSMVSPITLSHFLLSQQRH